MNVDDVTVHPKGATGCFSRSAQGTSIPAGGKTDQIQLSGQVWANRAGVWL